MVPPSQTSDQFWSALPIFEGMTPDQLARARAVLHPRSVRAGHTLMTEEQPGDVVYIIAQGSVKIGAQEGGDDVIIAVRGPGEIVGEMSVLDGMGRSATVTTQEACLLFWISRADFWSVLWEMPPFPLNMSRLLAQRLRVLTSQVRAMATLDVQGRLARQLVTLAEEYGRPHLLPQGQEFSSQGQGTLIPFQLKQAELAGMIGATREQVNKLLGSWTRRGLISRHEGKLVIHGSASLQRLYGAAPHRAAPRGPFSS